MMTLVRHVAHMGYTEITQKFLLEKLQGGDHSEALGVDMTDLMAKVD
jgi:hypothetical protein